MPFEEVYIEPEKEIQLIRKILIRLYLWVTNTNATTKQNLLDVIDEYRAVLEAALPE